LLFIFPVALFLRVSATAPFSSIVRWLGKTPSSQPGKNTASNSSPFAA